MEGCISLNANGISASEQYPISGTVMLKYTMRRKLIAKSWHEINILTYSPVDYKHHPLEHVIVDGKYVLK